MLKFIHWVARSLAAQGKERVILDREEKSVYLKRYYLIWGDALGDRARPWWCPINVMLHHICRSDEDELHDHPWWNCSVILTGGYWEITPKGRFWRRPGSILFRRAKAQHRLEINLDKEVWTLFAIAPRIRDWGFITEAGKWVQWQEYLSSK